MHESSQPGRHGHTEYTERVHDPFSRGPHPVGVKSDDITDAARTGRKLPLEIWYPAHDRHKGQDCRESSQDRYPLLGNYLVRQEAVRDAAPAEGTFPLVLFSHGLAGHRRQSTFVCTHLASHGYVVIAVDHDGNTMQDMMAMALSASSTDLTLDAGELIGSYAFDRPRDITAILDALARSAVRELPLEVDVRRVGMMGHSFGGWTTLVAAAHDARIVAALPLAPAGGRGPLYSAQLTRALDLALLGGRVDTLYLALERDSLLPLEGIRAMFAETPQPARILVLRGADHMHFCDRVERSHEFFRSLPPIGPLSGLISRLPPMSELVPGAHGYLFANAMAVAHMDAVLKHDSAARTLRDEQAVSAFAARGVTILSPLSPPPLGEG